MAYPTHIKNAPCGSSLTATARATRPAAGVWYGEPRCTASGDRSGAVAAGAACQRNSARADDACAAARNGVAVGEGCTARACGERERARAAAVRRTGLASGAELPAEMPLYVSTLRRLSTLVVAAGAEARASPGLPWAGARWSAACESTSSKQAMPPIAPPAMAPVEEPASPLSTAAGAAGGCSNATCARMPTSMASAESKPNLGANPLAASSGGKLPSLVRAVRREFQ